MSFLNRGKAVAAINRGFVEDPAEGPRRGVDGGWWHERNRSTYIALFNILVDRYGIDSDEAYSLLGGAFGAAADEYGD